MLMSAYSNSRCPLTGQRPHGCGAVRGAQPTLQVSRSEVGASSAASAPSAGSRYESPFERRIGVPPAAVDLGPAGRQDDRVLIVRATQKLRQRIGPATLRDG